MPITWSALFGMDPNYGKSESEEFEKLRRQVAAVLALHVPYDDGDPDFCSGCDQTYPCETIRAMEKP